MGNKQPDVCPHALWAYPSLSMSIIHACLFRTWGTKCLWYTSSTINSIHPIINFDKFLSFHSKKLNCHHLVMVKTDSPPGTPSVSYAACCLYYSTSLLYYIHICICIHFINLSYSHKGFWVWNKSFDRGHKQNTVNSQYTVM